MSFKDILEKMIEINASDIFIRANSPLRARICGNVRVVNDKTLTPEDVETMVLGMCDDYQKDILKKDRNSEFAVWLGDHWRFRVGVFYQRNTLAVVVRRIDLNIPTFQELNLPGKVLEKFCREHRGLILLTGITGSGKTTAIASMIEFINKNFGKHVLTIEEPIEFVFDDKKSLINQREIGKDVHTYEDALRQFTLHSPDVIYIGNIRDQKTCHAALTAAETGVLVFSTIHTINASSTIERIVNFFPPHQQHLVRSQLSLFLKGVLSLRLIPRIDIDGLIPAYEAMILSPTISRLLRENKAWEIPKYISSGDIYGMKTFNQCLIELIEARRVSPQVALESSDKKEELEMQLRNKGLL